MKNLGLKLQLYRKSLGLTQQQVADESGVGVKSVASFERARSASMKVSQLAAVLAVYHLTFGEFEAWTPEVPFEQTAPFVALEQPVALVRRREPVDCLRAFRKGDDDGRSSMQSTLAHAG